MNGSIPLQLKPNKVCNKPIFSTPYDGSLLKEITQPCGNALKPGMTILIVRRFDLSQWTPTHVFILHWRINGDNQSQDGIRVGQNRDKAWGSEWVAKTHTRYSRAWKETVFLKQVQLDRRWCGLDCIHELSRFINHHSFNPPHTLACCPGIIHKSWLAQDSMRIISTAKQTKSSCQFLFRGLNQCRRISRSAVCPYLL